MLNIWLVGLLEVTATTLTVYNAYSLKRQFYPACVYLSKSHMSIMVLVSFLLYLMFLLGHLLKTILFGTLRLIEVEHLQEYGWLTVSESFLAMTIFRDEFDVRFVLLFTTVFFIKAFHWISRDRVDYMEQTAQLPKYFHPRMLTVIYMLIVADCYGLYACIRHVIENGPSMAILFANEFALLVVLLMSIMVRYVLNTLDIRRGTPWEHRSVFLFYYDFVVDLLKLIIYSTFFGVIVVYYGIPLHIIRDLYLTFRSFVIRVQDIIRYRRATANMDQRYPNATPEELARTDHICIICREEMTFAKKLPCGHLFHFRCLRSWLERQQACPTCRRPILDQQQAGPAEGGPARPEPEGHDAEHARGHAREQIPPQAQGQEQRRPVLEWRNGRWVALGGGGEVEEAERGAIPAGRTNLNVPTARQAAGIVEPLPPPPPPPPANQMPFMAAAPIVYPNMSLGSFTTPSASGVLQMPQNILSAHPIPVILVPPEQIALVQPPRIPHPPPNVNIDGGDRDRDRDTNLTTHRPIPTTPQATPTEPIQLPPRPHTSSPALPSSLTANTVTTTTSSPTSRPLYMLRQAIPDQEPIYLEPLSALPHPPLTAGEIHMEHLSGSDVNTIRASVREQIHEELQILTRLQLELITLTERIMSAETRLQELSPTTSLNAAKVLREARRQLQQARLENEHDDADRHEKESDHDIVQEENKNNSNQQKHNRQEGKFKNYSPQDNNGQPEYDDNDKGKEGINTRI